MDAERHLRRSCAALLQTLRQARGVATRRITLCVCGVSRPLVSDLIPERAPRRLLRGRTLAGAATTRAAATSGGRTVGPLRVALRRGPLVGSVTRIVGVGGLGRVSGLRGASRLSATTRAAALSAAGALSTAARALDSAARPTRAGTRRRRGGGGHRQHPVSGARSDQFVDGCRRCLHRLGVDLDTRLLEQLGDFAALRLEADRDDGPLGTRACRATRPVQVRLVLDGRIHVDDELDLVDVHAAGCDIRRYQHPDAVAVQSSPSRAEVKALSLLAMLTCGPEIFNSVCRQVSSHPTR